MTLLKIPRYKIERFLTGERDTITSVLPITNPISQTIIDLSHHQKAMHNHNTKRSSFASFTYKKYKPGNFYP